VKVKCPKCTGNTNNNRETLYLYTNGSYWCARCKSQGRITELGENFYNQINIRPRIINESPTINWNGRGLRFSVCRKRDYSYGSDCYQLKSVTGNSVGTYSRRGRESTTVGQRAFCYKEEYLDLAKTYRIVEGVYDCVYPEDVSIQGIPSSVQAQQLKPYNLILCPDGDIWLDKDKLKLWFLPFWHNKVDKVEYIADGKDPDEATVEQRKSVDWLDLKNYIRRLK